MSHDHDHDDGQDHATRAGVSRRREAKLRVAMWLNIAIVAVQVVFGFIAHSLGLIADAATTSPTSPPSPHHWSPCAWRGDPPTASGPSATTAPR